jgi:hypothetical protein
MFVERVRSTALTHSDELRALMLLDQPRLRHMPRSSRAKRSTLVDRAGSPASWSPSVTLHAPHAGQSGTPTAFPSRPLD